jgi:transposase
MGPCRFTTAFSPTGSSALTAVLAAERQARQEAEARATGAETMVAYLKLVIAKLRRKRFGPSAERGAKLLDQLELQIEELEVRGQRRAHRLFAGELQHDRPILAGDGEFVFADARLERMVIPAPTACPCCGGKLAKLGEDITETLEVVPRQWKVVQTVREKFTRRRCEKITQPAAPFHTIAVAGPAPACWR